MGDSENDVVLGNTGPSGDNNAAYGNFEVGSRFLQVSEQETSEFVKNNRNSATRTEYVPCKIFSVSKKTGRFRIRTRDS